MLGIYDKKNICLHERKKKLTFPLIMSVKIWGGGQKALAVISAKIISMFLDGSPWVQKL